MCRSAFARGLSNSQAVCPKHGIRVVPSLRSTSRHLPRRKFLVSFSNRELGRAPTLPENPTSDPVCGRLRALPRSIDAMLTPYADAYFRGIGLHRESDATAGTASEPPPEGRVGRQPRSGVKFSCGDGSGEPRVGAGQRSPTRKAANAQECSRRTLTLPARPLQPWKRTIVQLPGAARGVIGLAGSYKARVDPGPNDGGPTRGPRRTR